MTNNLKILALGGLDEDGKNLYCIEIDGKIFIVNCGIKHPEDNMFGVAVVVPDFKYLLENSERCKALIITHLADDMMDAVPYLLKQLNVPVYAPALCCWVLNSVLKQHGLTNVKLNMLPRYGETDIADVKVTSFGLTHSTPDAIGVSFETPEGQVVVAEKFVVDFDVKTKCFASDISALADIGKKGVLCALIESAYADRDGFTAPAHRVNDLLRPVFEDAQGRIFVTIYRQNYFRISEVINLCKEYNKKIFVYDENLKNVLNIISSLKYFSIPKELEVSRENFNDDDDDIVVLITGIDQRTFAKVRKIAIGEDELIEFRSSDTIAIASPVVPGTLNRASSMEDELYRDNVNIVKLNAKQVLSMHPSKEDIKTMLHLLKPKYLIPVMGDYRQFISLGQLAVNTGMKDDDVIILDNGQSAEFKNGRLINHEEFVDVGESMIDSAHKKAVTSAVLKDREALSTDGVIICGIAISYTTKEVIGGPDIQSRGVIYVKDSEYIIKNISKLITDVIDEMVTNGVYDNMGARVEIRERISKYVLRETGKKPMVLPVIIEINI